MAVKKKTKKKMNVKLEDLKDLTKKDIESIAGGKSVMPSSTLAGYRLLKVYDPTYTGTKTLGG